MKRLIILSSLFLASCGPSQYSFSVMESAGLSSEYSGGNQIFLSEGKNTNLGVMVQRNEKFTDTAQSVVSVTNVSGRKQNVSPSNFAILLNGQVRLPILSEATLRARVEKAQYWENFGNALSTAIDNANASQSGYQTTYGNVGGYTYSSQTYNSAAVSAQQAANNQKSAQRKAEIDAKAAANLTKYSKSVLKAETLAPNTSVTGLIFFDLPNNRRQGDQTFNYVLKAYIADDEHEFKLRERKLNN